MRQLQLDIAREMISPSCGRSASFQLNMGEGKSSVIVPFVAASLADGSNLARIVTLKPLSNQMFQLLFGSNGDNHPLWTAAVKKANGSPLFSRHTTTTALRLAVGHAFTADCSRRLRPDIPEHELHCPCGFPDNSFHHILYDCPRYECSRRAVAPLTQWDSILPHHYFRKFPHTENLLDFLQCSRAAFKPSNELAVPYDPG